MFRVRLVWTMATCIVLQHQIASLCSLGTKLSIVHCALWNQNHGSLSVQRTHPSIFPKTNLYVKTHSSLLQTADLMYNAPFKFALLAPPPFASN